MNRIIGFCLLIGTSYQSHAYTFNDAIKAIETHEIVESLEYDSHSLDEEGSVKGSWGDPMFRVAAKNFPKDTMKDDQTPMTGIEFGLSQKIALTTKYGNIEDSFRLMGKSRRFEASDKKNELIRNLWLVLIESRKLNEESNIIRENTDWIKKILKISKRLYATGKISQQALLDIQIRKSELETLYSNKVFDKEALAEKLSYILGFRGKVISERTIPWSFVDKKSSKTIDNKELSLKSLTHSKDKMLTAQKLNYIPDVTLSIGYTKRSDLDDNGDFVSAMVSFPLPLSGKTYAAHRKASFDKYSAEKKLENYKRFKVSERKRLEKIVQKTQKELKILSTKTIKFAENSRKVTSKSYSLGSSSYVELLQSELKLQKLLIRKSNITATLFKHKINLKYLIGEALNE